MKDPYVCQNEWHKGEREGQCPKCKAEIAMQLDLTSEEAFVLAMVLRNVGGHPETTARGHTDRVYDALALNGFKPTQNDTNAFIKSGSPLYMKSRELGSK